MISQSHQSLVIRECREMVFFIWLLESLTKSMADVEGKADFDIALGSVPAMQSTM